MVCRDDTGYAARAANRPKVIKDRPGWPIDGDALRYQERWCLVRDHVRTANRGYGRILLQAGRVSMSILLRAHM